MSMQTQEGELIIGRCVLFSSILVAFTDQGWKSCFDETLKIKTLLGFLKLLSFTLQKV